jgi:WD40 repeat protein
MEKCSSVVVKTELSVAFSPDNQLIASGIDDGIIQLRSMDKREFELPLSLKIPKPYEGMNITGVIGLTEDLKTKSSSIGSS